MPAFSGRRGERRVPSLAQIVQTKVAGVTPDTGTNYPANSLATISVNGSEIGEVETDSNGDLSFIIATANSDPGSYTVTAAVDVNASAAANFTLIINGQFQPSPGNAPIFSLEEVNYFPAVRKA
jgi:hypothetical protein